jgi:chromosome segregation ATPase
LGNDLFSSMREFLEEMLAPSVRSLDERMEQLRERNREIASELKDIRRENLETVRFMHSELASLKERVGRLEGRSEGLKSELTAVLESEMLKALHGSRVRALPQPSDGGDSP